MREVMKRREDEEDEEGNEEEGESKRDGKKKTRGRRWFLVTLVLWRTKAKNKFVG
jgi:hypothetical protein